MESSIILPNNEMSTPANRPSFRGRPIAWSIIGTDFKGQDVSVAEAIQQAGMDFNVSAQPLVRIPQEVYDAILTGDIENVMLSKRNLIHSHKATIRDDIDGTLGIVGRDYGIVQNARAFELIDHIEKYSGIKPKIDNVGVLEGGSRVYVSCRLDDGFDLNPNDHVDNYVVFTTTHDGSGSVMAFFTPIRVWCQNSLNVAIAKTQNKITFKHSSRVNEWMDFKAIARTLIDRHAEYNVAFREAMEQMKAIRVDAQIVNDFAAKMMLPAEAYKAFVKNNFNLMTTDEISTMSRNKVLALTDAIEHGVGQEVNRGSGAWLFNGITTYLHNERNYTSAEDEFKSILGGSVNTKTNQAFEYIMAMA